MNTTFGKLTSVDLRTAWTREDTHFTPWLAKPENLSLLGETISVGLELVGEEQSVGPFRADILCKNTADSSFVLIENQIERTDHTHLGQVITYAAGLDAVTIVWIAKRFTEEHRAALDWINEISHENIRFFGLEVELWKIGESPVAPKFNIVARPNDWSKVVRETRGGATSEHQAFRYEFWQAFLEHLAESGSRLSSGRTPSRDHWMMWGIGRTGFNLESPIGFRDKWCAAQLYVGGTDGSDDFLALQSQKEDLERELGFELYWDTVEGRKASYIGVRLEEVDPMDRAQWPKIHQWIRERLEKLDAVFRERVAVLGTSGTSVS